jgi:general secretion pathway protein D
MAKLLRIACSALIASWLLTAQTPPPPPPGFGPTFVPQPAKPETTKPAPAKPAPQPPGGQPQPAQQPPAQTRPQPAPGTQPAVSPAPAPAAPIGGLQLQNASLVQVIDMLARDLKINYILDPRVKGGVILNTYGETRNIDERSLLETILRINNAGMVKVGDIYRIVPLSDINRLPLEPEQMTSPKEIPNDDQTMLNLVFLKYATVDELQKVLQSFIGEGAQMISYPPANLLFLLDSRRNMRRTMELIAMFDSDILANQRVRLFEIKNARPSDLADELKKVLTAVSLSDKNASVKFLPVDRINTLIAVAPNPGVFSTVANWIEKLDVPMKSSGGAVESHVYRVKYQRAECLGMVLMQLYGSYYGLPPGYGMGMFGPYAGYGPYGAGAFGAGGYGMGYGAGYGGYGAGYGGYGAGYATYGGGGAVIGGVNAGLGVGAGCGGMGYGMGMGMGYGMGGYPGMYGAPYGFGSPYGMGMYPGGYAPQYPLGAGPAAATGATQPGSQQTGAAGSADLTGSYLSAARAEAMNNPPRVVPNPMNNSLLIEATPAQYQDMLKMLRQLDVPPRQILLDAKIYEVTLSGAFASGVAAYLQQKGASLPLGAASRALTGQLVGDTTTLSAGALIGASKQLMAFLSLQENQSRTRVLSAPSLIATDSIPASITVGAEVPVYTSQAVSSVQQGGTNQFAQTIGSRSTGVTLNVMARVNPSGIVTLIINQDVSAPGAPPVAGPQTSSFSERNVQTQITLQDGDTIAIGGIILEDHRYATAGIPLLNRVPLLGAAFGSRSYSKERTELIVFMTPHIIYDNADLQEASEELKSRIRMLRKYVVE